MTAEKSTRYILALAVAVTTILAGVFVLNYTVDPLWFFGGNKVQPRNFPFDERVARLAHFSDSDKDFDCLIFGASRTSMMNEHNFAGHKCFMVSFANATPPELLAYAKYIKSRNKREPSLVIVGVDDFDFIDIPESTALDLPSDVVHGRTPHFWQYYFSSDVAGWSIDTLFDLSPKPRYYGGDLTGRIRHDANSLRILRLKLDPHQKLRMSLANVANYARFRQLFPKAHLVAYATPVAAVQIEFYKKNGLLPDYVKALHETAAQFDEMYDFSIPSAITTNPDLTYDGSHYQPAVSDRIAAAIQSHQPDFGIVLSGQTIEQIFNLYCERLMLYNDRARSAERLQKLARKN